MKLRIRIMFSNPCYMRDKRLGNPLWGSPHSNYYGRKPFGVLDVTREHREVGLSNSKNKIQYILYLKAKLLETLNTGEFVSGPRTAVLTV